MSDDAPIRFESVYFALNQLGAQAGILEKLSRLFEPSSVQYIDPEVRSDVLWRLVASVTACARYALTILFFRSKMLIDMYYSY